MFKRILVPLDGSPRAEQAIPFAARLARASGGSILLVRIVRVVSESGMFLTTEPSIPLQEVRDQDLVKATGYLARVAEAPDLAGIDVRIAVFSGRIITALLDVARTQQMDVIVMSSHGYTGIKRWALGSVAQQVVRHSTLPVLVLHESYTRGVFSKEVSPLHTLVALDGSAFAEAALLPAAQFVAACSAPARGTLHLTQLVKTPTVEEKLTYGRVDTTRSRKTALYRAGDYLQTVRENVFRELATVESGLTMTWSVEECIDVADTLIKIAELGEGIRKHAPCDMMALTTHGRSGLQRLFLGSVTERVLGRTTLPLLVVHPLSPTPSEGIKRPLQESYSI
ncbi:MAG TPA: universal stress protein [Ktedonosporobacter sp.]|nr:universal stress protein [Ktedonosporobacter sp.]